LRFEGAFGIDEVEVAFKALRPALGLRELGDDEPSSSCDCFL